MNSLIQELNDRNRKKREEEFKKIRKDLHKEWSNKMKAVCKTDTDFAASCETIFELYMKQATNVITRVNEQYPFIYGQ